MNLHTGCHCHGRTLQCLPITADVIPAFEKLARDQNQPHMNNSPIFEWGPNLPMEGALLEDDLSFEDDDDSVATIPILPLLLPQPETPLNDDEHSTSTDNPGPNTNDDSDADIAAAPDAAILTDAPTNFAVAFDNINDEPVPANVATILPWS